MAGGYLYYVIHAAKPEHVGLIKALWRVGDGIHELEIKEDHEHPYTQVKAWLVKLKLFQDGKLRFSLFVEHYQIASLLALQWVIRGKAQTPQKKYQYEIYIPECNVDDFQWKLKRVVRKLPKAQGEALLRELGDMKRSALAAGDTDEALGLTDEEMPF